MNYIDRLVENYERFVSLPWERDLPHAQRVWMLVYPPDQERRIRLHLDSFQIATTKAKHPWKAVDVTHEFERWLGAQEYRDAYFVNPGALQPALSEFMKDLEEEVIQELTAVDVDQDTVVILLGAASLFGLGPQARVSALMARVQEKVRGRLMVLFPGSHEGNTYRLLDAQEGWNYLAIPISADGVGGR